MSGSDSPQVNAMNDCTTKKSIDSRATGHIFCNIESFVSDTPKISTCETGTDEKFTAQNIPSSVPLAALFGEQIIKISTPASIAGIIYYLFAKECCQRDGRRDRISEKMTLDDVTLTNVLYSFQLQYNFISTSKLTQKIVKTFLVLPDNVSQLFTRNQMIDVADMINDQYVLREIGSRTTLESSKISTSESYET